MAGQWFSPGTPVSSSNKTDSHDITELLFKVVLNSPSLMLSQRIGIEDLWDYYLFRMICIFPCISYGTSVEELYLLFVNVMKKMVALCVFVMEDLSLSLHIHKFYKQNVCHFFMN